MNKTVLIGAGAVLIVLIIGAVMMKGNAEVPQNAVNQEAGEAANPLAGASPVVDGSYTVIPEQSSVNWEGRKTLIADYKDTGTISMKSGALTVLDGKVTGGSIVFDMNSIRVSDTGKKAGQSTLEKHLKSQDFFAVEQFPTAEFTIKEAIPAGEAAGATQYTLTGDLTVKGITHPISFPVVAYIKDGLLYAEASTEVDRTKWDIRYGSDKFFDNLANNVIDDEFTLAFQLVAKR